MERSDQWQTAQILKGELLRRLGRFNEAKAHLTMLQSMEQFQDNFLADIVRYELELCDKRDSRPHEVAEVTKK